MQKEMRSSKVATFFAWPVSVVLAMVFLFLLWMFLRFVDVLSERREHLWDNTVYEGRYFG